MITIRSLGYASLAIGAVALAAGCSGQVPQRTAPAAVPTFPPLTVTTTATITTTTSTPPTTTQAPGPQTVFVVPAPAAPPQVQTQYVPYPSYSGGTNYTPSYSSSGAAADADFLFRMRARQIVTPGDAQEVYGAHIVCQGLDDGNSLTTQANALQQAPYNYRASLAGYFAGEAVKVYCPQFSYLLKP